MSRKCVEETDKAASSHEGHDRRATEVAGADWREARGDQASPTLAALGIEDTAGEGHDRFLVRGDSHMLHAVFIGCGDTLRSHWGVGNLGATLEDVLPDDLLYRFAEGCERSLMKGSPVLIDGSYHDRDGREVLFRCTMMPVQSLGDGPDFIYGAYSHKIVA
ncbi:MAG: hypothetical protein QF578_08955 [Alphaproteobacteria bacterium]|jgi:hypothetical protein|nr:hypothetical protein [Alphaproteobacteria bacterium]